MRKQNHGKLLVEFILLPAALLLALGLSHTHLGEELENLTLDWRFQARAKGRGNRILKHTCHIYVTVGD